MTGTFWTAASANTLHSSVTPPILAGLGWTKSTASALSRRSKSITVSTFSPAAIGLPPLLRARARPS
jgi:hypothetical protein